MAFFAFNPNNSNNRRSHPFWDFVASMDDLNQRPPSYAPRDRPERGQAGEQRQEAEKTQNEEKGNYRAPSVEDEKMADASARPSKKEERAERRAERKENKKARHESESSSSSSEEGPWGHRHGCRRGHGPPPFGLWGFPGPFGLGNGDFSDWTGPHHGHRHHRGLGRRHWGPPPSPGSADHPAQPEGPGFDPRGHRGPPQAPGAAEHGPPAPGPGFGPHGHAGRRHQRGGPFGRRGPGRDLNNIPAFLAQLGNRLGLDLNGAAANLGLDLSRAAAGADSDIDFVPAHDLFDLKDEYLVHVSLPGAHREDLGLDFDGESHALRVGGVVYRPNVDEHISSAITHSGRNREVGVFETKIHLPSKNDESIEVNAANISAKLRDGILVVHVPKIHKRKEDMKRSIRIGSPSPSPEPEPREALTNTNLPTRGKDDVNRNNPFAAETKEKENNNNNHNEADMYYSSPQVFSAHGDETADAAAAEAARKESEYDHVMKDQEDQEQHHVGDPPEEVPKYTPFHQDIHEQEEEDDHEGEYVKINVD